jgi:hypothetical protein
MNGIFRAAAVAKEMVANAHQMNMLTTMIKIVMDVQMLQTAQIVLQAA